MSEQIIIPSLGESITEASIAKLLKKPGDTVKVDDVILELETEKVNIEVTAKSAGVITSLSKNQGDNVKVGEVIGLIEENGNVSKTNQTTTKSITNDNQKSKDHVNENNSFAPSVNKLIKENNLDPKNITGTGKRGMLTKGDILSAMENSTTVKQYNNSEEQDTQVNHKSIERVKMSKLRQTIAKRLKDSQNTAAILTTFNEINMAKVMELRQTYKEMFEKKYNTKLGFMSFFIKATVEALKNIPAVNAEISGEDIIYKNYYDIGVAVGTEQGLVVPVVRNCDKLSFSQIETSIISYSEKAKAGKLAMDDLTGGTFTISNGGVYGSLLSTPIINPPQSGILGLHKIEERPIVLNGKIEIRPMMYVALSYDHRIIDGKDAVTFLVKIKENIENPERLLLNV